MLSISCFESNSFNNIFHQVIKLNNTGVDFYKLGNYEAAIQCLYNALSGMQQFSAFHQGSLRGGGSEQQTIMESMTSTHDYSRDSITPPRMNQNNATREYIQQFRYTQAQAHDTAPPSNYLQGESHQQSQSHPNRETTTSGFNNEQQQGNQCHSSLLSCISYAHSVSSAGTRSNSCLMDSSTHDTQGNSMVPIDTTAIYRYALNLVCHGDCTEAMANPMFSCSRADAARIRASVLFNLGLAHHMIAANASSFFINHGDAILGISMGDPLEGVVSRSLEKAKSFYQLSLKLQESEKAPISTHYLMALCNNIGQCYVGLNRRSESIAWVERLLRLLVCYQQSREFQHRSQPANECFIRNTSSLILRDPYTAPTA